MLKVNLVLKLVLVTVGLFSQKVTAQTLEYSLISQLLVERDWCTINKEFISWESQGFDEYDDFNPKKAEYADLFAINQNLDLDSLIGHNYKEKIKCIISLKNRNKIKRKEIDSNCNKVKFNQANTSVLYFTNPIVLKSERGEMYALIIESFEGETIYCIYKRIEMDFWEKIHKTMISIE
ncbi:hypothetical protein [Algoriphagus sp.]|uniref:hypothetical protein n=1 Tax=Algoriphagus sp. TaxID=1872435 RepID=UPI002625919F|nr:hypothetical protein [Algoriphagus sp.]